MIEHKNLYKRICLHKVKKRDGYYIHLPTYTYVKNLSKIMVWDVASSETLQVQSFGRSHDQNPYKLVGLGGPTLINLIDSFVCETRDPKLIINMQSSFKNLKPQS